jgi:hypothetical protein
VKRGSPARRRRRRSSNSSSPMLTPPFCHPRHAIRSTTRAMGAGAFRGPVRSNRQYHLDNPPPLTVRLQPFGSDAHGHQTGGHWAPPGRSPRSAESPEPRIGGSRLRIGHAARQRSDQGFSIARGRGPRVQVGPTTHPIDVWLSGEQFVICVV